MGKDKTIMLAKQCVKNPNAKLHKQKEDKKTKTHIISSYSLITLINKPTETKDTAGVPVCMH